MKLVYAFASLTGLALADLPVSCPYSATLGTWEVSIGTSGSDQSIVGKCGLTNLGDVTTTKTFLLEEQDEVTNVETGSKGSYTIVSSQGFEISIDGRKFWASYKFDCDENGKNCVSDCSQTIKSVETGEICQCCGCDNFFVDEFVFFRLILILLYFRYLLKFLSMLPPIDIIRHRLHILKQLVTRALRFRQPVLPMPV